MRFSRFRLTGFKSFVEPTEVSIKAGLTGIVGPNGCGKSNLVEALQWVMGESSYKAMRGSEMEDVIFSGSTARPARNAAEVSLTINNSERKAPAGFNDNDAIEISRRIERDAGSAYRINGRDVRARDVQLLFADAAIGAHSAAIVSQGRVGSLISAKPEARRAILEEAAGVFGLFGRRHEAEMRLNAAEQNLDRLEDVLSEIERQLEGLRRQARQAVRYRNLSGDIRKAEATALAVRYSFAAQSLAAAESEFKDAAAVATQSAVVQSAAMRDQAEAAAVMPSLRDQAAATEAGLQRIRMEHDRLDREEMSLKDEIADLERRANQLGDDLDRERGLLADCSETLSRLTAEKLEAASDTAGHMARRGYCAERLDAAETNLAESERMMAEANAASADLKVRRDRTRSDVEALTEREQLLRAEIGSIADERDSLSSAGSNDRLELARQQLTAAQSELGVAERGSLAAEGAVAMAREQASAAQTSLTEIQTALSRLETEADAIRTLLPQSSSSSPLVDRISTVEGSEAAVAAALGDDLNISDDPSDASHWRSVKGENDPALPAGAQPMSDSLDGPSVLARRLSQTGIVVAADGPRLQALLRPGQVLVSLAGDIWRWDGIVASSEVRSTAANQISTRRRLNELSVEIEALRPMIAEESRQLLDARDSLAEATQQVANSRESWRTALAVVNQKRDDLAAAEREFSGVASRLAALAEAETRLSSDLAETTKRRESAAAALNKMPLSDALERPITSLREKMQADRSTAAELKASLAGIDRDHQARQERIVAIGRDEAAWIRRSDGAKNQIEALSARLEQIGTLRRSLDERPEAIASQRRALLNKSADAEGKRAAASDALATAEARMADADKRLLQANEATSSARELRGRLEERVSGAKGRMIEIGDRIREVLDCDPSDANKAAGIADGAQLPALDQVEARLERLKQERERLGGVNLQADREAQEAAERRDTMTSDRDDLIAAINKLRQGIGGLNREGRERLRAAFETVNTQFQRLFEQLFGGGTAELKLVGSEDPLEAGLEIVAKPPGKKPQTMTLLSGGEQALTALSLIFAVFLTKPAPICVLDEVDAPLDDANVERFCALLDTIAKETGTRFLVITHNPITMARMNRLFGVTMTERGVSQLVSVDLETAEKYREAG